MHVVLGGVMLLWRCNKLEKSIGSVYETIARDGCDHVGGGYAFLLLDPAQNVENYKECESNGFSTTYLLLHA